MRILASFIVFFLLMSCGSSKKISSSDKERKISVAAAHNSRIGTESEMVPEENTASTVTTNSFMAKADLIINTALTFSGVRYKFGGTTLKGMDCSGLLYVSFAEHDVQLPRTSYDMAEEGERIKVNDVQKGDLLFFKTSKRSKRINHVGMVVGIDDDEITFIHASTSRGVIVSSLRDGFWNQAFVKATRIL